MNNVLCHQSQNIIVSHAQTPGRCHCEKSEPCQDVIFIRHTSQYLFCGIADGQSGAKYGAEAGRTCLETIADYVEKIGVEHILNTPFPDELPCMIVKEFRKSILSLAESKGAGFQEFASTLLAIAVDLTSGKYILLHLGDGCAISIPSIGDAAVISAPENDFTMHHTWLTTSDNAVLHLRITFGSLANKKRLLLVSDGAVCFCRGKNIPWRIKEFLKVGSLEEIQSHLLTSNPLDDASCIILDCYANEPLLTAARC